MEEEAKTVIVKEENMFVWQNRIQKHLKMKVESIDQY